MDPASIPVFRWLEVFTCYEDTDPRPRLLLEDDPVFDDCRRMGFVELRRDPKSKKGATWVVSNDGWVWLGQMMEELRAVHAPGPGDGHPEPA